MSAYVDPLADDGWAVPQSPPRQQQPPADPVPPTSPPASASSSRLSPKSARTEPLSPRERASNNAQAPPRAQPMPVVRVKVIAIEKTRRDIYFRFSAETNMPSFCSASYRNVSRSYAEFVKFADALAGNNPQSVVPALPLAQTCAATDDEDDRLVKLSIQRWISRVTSDPMLVRDDELRSFVESDFGYTPVTKLRRRVGSSFGFSRLSSKDYDDDLTRAKGEMAHLEDAFATFAKSVDKLAKARRAATTDISTQMSSFATSESHAPLSNGFKRLARTEKLLTDIQAAEATTELVTLFDNFSYQSANARVAKETLMARDVLLEEYRNAVKATIAKRKTIERMRGGSSIKAEKVDDALEDFEEARRTEVSLQNRLQAISQFLQPSLRAHSQHQHEDIFAALLDHSRATLVFERQLLQELETVKPELEAIKPFEPGIYYHQPTAAAPSSPSPSSPAPSLRRETTTMGGHDITRRSVHTLAQSVAVPKREKIDARKAASLLANGF